MNAFKVSHPTVLSCPVPVTWERGGRAGVYPMRPGFVPEEGPTERVTYVVVKEGRRDTRRTHHEVTRLYDQTTTFHAPYLTHIVPSSFFSSPGHVYAIVFERLRHAPDTNFVYDLLWELVFRLRYNGSLRIMFRTG